MTGLYDGAERSDVESHGQRVLAALSAGRFDRAHGQGVSDAAFSRGYGERRASSADKRDYALGYHLGRYMLFAGLPRWRSPVNPETALATLEAFKLSAEGRKFTALYGEPFPAIAGLIPAQLEALKDWNPGSVGGRAILDGWQRFEAGEPCPEAAWPYLRERGWHAAKVYAEQLQLVESTRRELEQEESGK